MHSCVPYECSGTALVLFCTKHRVLHYIMSTHAWTSHALSTCPEIKFTVDTPIHLSLATLEQHDRHMRNLIAGSDIYSNSHISEIVLHGYYKVSPCGSELELSLWHSLHS